MKEIPHVDEVWGVLSRKEGARTMIELISKECEFKILH